MNYRHVYHAGNFADCLKHIILLRVLAYMAQKPAPFRVIDTHAGAGSYDLDCPQASKTGEWRDGIARLIEADHPAELMPVLGPYLEAVAAAGFSGRPAVYPGSPALIRQALRRDDYFIANEKHGEDAALLKARLLNARNTKVMAIDGYTLIKSALPPKERRGVVLIDPPFENDNEFGKIQTALEDARERFETGVYLIWYPVKDQAAALRLRAQAALLWPGKVLDCRLRISVPEPGLGLTETGVLSINPPFTLEAELERLLPYLAGLLAIGRGYGHQVWAG